MKSIPSVLRTVRIPAELSVTALAGARPCLLAPVASDDPSVPLLRLGPQAELGHILHKLVEDASRGNMGSGTDADVVVRSHLEFLLREASQKLSGDASSRPYAKLKDSFSFLDWHSRTEIAIAEAALDYARSCKSAPRLRERPAGSADLNVLLSRTGDFTLFEVPFRSRNLRLKGRIDELAKQASGTIQVIDYKTGRILDTDGNLFASIVLQLRLYVLCHIGMLAPGLRATLCPLP
jgi:ATP-dependent exoDNAse (exonuclease V) beta subunit